MKKVILSAVLAAMVLSFAGCDSKQEEVKTVDYYKEHDAERKAKIEECKNNPGELKGTPNCVNALTAQSQDYKMPDLNRVADPSKYEKF